MDTPDFSLKPVGQCRVFRIKIGEYLGIGQIGTIPHALKPIDRLRFGTETFGKAMTFGKLVICPTYPVSGFE